MNDLPEHLRDPMKVLERGRQLEESGGVKLSSKELLPCPFCGHFLVDGYATCTAELDGNDGVQIGCPLCDAQGPVAVDEEAAKYSWNLRAITRAAHEPPVTPPGTDPFLESQFISWSESEGKPDSAREAFYAGFDARTKLQAESPTQPPEDGWVIYYEDRDEPAEHFYGHGAEDAARRRFEQRSMAWTCRLFRCIAKSGYGPTPTKEESR